MKKLMLSLLTLTMALGLALGAQAANLKIGTLSPLTGSEAADGNDIVKGVKAAVAVFEEEGKIPGFDKIEVVSQDDACDPRQAVSGAEKLVNEKVAGVVGAYCSSATIPASLTLNENKIIMITPASTNPQVTERKLPYMFRMCGRDDDQGPAAVKFIKDNLKAKTVFIVDDKTTYSQGLADKVEEVAKKEGLKVTHDHVNKDDKDFSAVLTKIKAAKPDVFYMSLQNSSTGSLMAIQAKRMGITAKIVAQDAVYHPQLIEIAKDAAEGIFLTFGFIDKNTQSYKKFLDKYTKLFNAKPGAYSAYAYDSAYALLTAIKNAKTADPEKVKAELMKLSFTGASKNVKFKPNGDTGSDYIIFLVKGGKFVEYWNPATGKAF